MDDVGGVCLSTYRNFFKLLNFILVLVSLSKKKLSRIRIAFLFYTILGVTALTLF